MCSDKAFVGKHLAGFIHMVKMISLLNLLFVYLDRISKPAALELKKVGPQCLHPCLLQVTVNHEYITQNGMENVNIDRVEQFQDAAQGHFGPPQLQLVSEALVERSI